MAKGATGAGALVANEDVRPGNHSTVKVRVHDPIDNAVPASRKPEPP
jgi:hypothetical protein